jgi:hypothetical protein
MRSKLMIGILVVVLTALVAGPMSASSAQEGPSETLTVILKFLRFKVIDVGRHGESPGDVVIFKDALFDETGTERIGTDWGECRLNFGGVYTCNITASIDGRGTITGTGAVSFAEEPRLFPITGGSGDFQQASGESELTVVDAETERIVFHLFGTTAS